MAAEMFDYSYYIIGYLICNYANCSLISEISDQLIVVPTAEKLNVISTIQICKTEAIDLMVTDLEPDDILLQSFQNAGIKLI